MREGDASSLPALLDEAIVRAGEVGPDLPQLEALLELKTRLAEGRLQLAVLGQFKRGKSTLLNALLGAPLAPVGVLPVTAIPTFIEAGDVPTITIDFDDGEMKVESFADEAPLGERLAELVTEAANPNNRLGVVRVGVQMPSPFLARNVVVIDTPGVGSTHQHNTEAAEATLPACDAALFVISPDPPITEVEINYLSQVRAVVGRIVVVLNKIDTVSPEESLEIEAFVRRALAERAGMGEAAPIFALSARQAIAAKLAGDDASLRSSGLPALETYLTDFLAREKHVILNEAIRRKASVLLGTLTFELSLCLRALQLPLQDLEARANTFNGAASDFEIEHRQVSDLLAMDRRRALDELDVRAAGLTDQLQNRLAVEVDQRAAELGSQDEAWRLVQDDLGSVFDQELEQAIASTRAGLEALFAERRRRAEDLIDLVNRTAAELLEVPFRPHEREGTFEARVLPYWQLARPEALNPFTPGSLDRLLPQSLREKRARHRVRAAIADLSIRNVENLRWAMRRNIDEAFRHFVAAMDDRFARSLAVTREMIATAIVRRGSYAEGISSEAAALEACVSRLAEIEVDLGADPAQSSQSA